MYYSLARIIQLLMVYRCARFLGRCLFGCAVFRLLLKDSFVLLKIMQMREAAERLLFSSSLDEKLLLAPESVSDDNPGDAIGQPDAPGRPDQLRMVPKGVKADFPGVNQLEHDSERGKMLHFLANHELLAAELMALVLLKFPDAPKEYRVGVYEAMREEQMHTLMYLRRMRECGVHFGELPLNDYFWRLIAPMDTPMDFVTRLNLTFEQANLDFSKHYAGLFRQVGDTGTAAVLEKIYQDEIGHVGHGVKWFRKWKADGETDWQAYSKSLSFPLAPAKAKGIAPFNVEGRRLAGLSEDFIRHLDVCEQSRGRTPVLHWFNPSAESYARPSAQRHVLNKSERALGEDLEMLILAWSRKEDMALLRKPPGREHLAYLKKAGFDLPEILAEEKVAEQDSLEGRKLGGLRPWAWSPDAAEILQPFANRVSPVSMWQWRGAMSSIYFSKEIGARLTQELGLTEGVGRFCCELEVAIDEITAMLAEGDVLLKAAYACAGRGHRKVVQGALLDEVRPWLEKVMIQHGGVMVEPWLERVIDFSSLYEIGETSENDSREPLARWKGMTRMENDAGGKFLGSIVQSKWGSDLDPDLREFLFRERKVTEFYRKTIPEILPKILSGYRGPVGVDAMVFRSPNGEYGLRHVVELNVRMTMGRVALELYQKLPTPAASGGIGRVRILRKNKLSETELLTLKDGVNHNGPVVINNPDHANCFLAVWEFID